jgi:hypothetical protein
VQQDRGRGGRVEAEQRERRKSRGRAGGEEEEEEEGMYAIHDPLTTLHPPTYNVGAAWCNEKTDCEQFPNPCPDIDNGWYMGNATHMPTAASFSPVQHFILHTIPYTLHSLYTVL